MSAISDNIVTQSTTPATAPSGTVIASRSVTYSGDANAEIAPVGLVEFSGADDAKTATDVGAGNPLHVRETGATSATSNVSGSASSVTVLASNANRLRAWLYNDSTSAANVKFGATASATSFTKRLLPGEFFPVEGYTGIIDAIWDSATGALRITELTA